MCVLRGVWGNGAGQLGPLAEVIAADIHYTPQIPYNESALSIKRIIVEVPPTNALFSRE